MIDNKYDVCKNLCDLIDFFYGLKAVLEDDKVFLSLLEPRNKLEKELIDKLMKKNNEHLEELENLEPLLEKIIKKCKDKGFNNV